MKKTNDRKFIKNTIHCIGSKAGTRLRSAAAFSMAEMLMVVAVLAVLMGVSFIPAQNYVKSTRQTRLDKTAETIYTAVQARLSEAIAFGDADKLGGASGGAEYLFRKSVSEDLCYVTSAGSGSAYNIISEVLPSDVNSKQWVVEYDATGGRVLDVFYSDNRGTFTFDSAKLDNPLVLVAHAYDDDDSNGDTDGDGSNNGSNEEQNTGGVLIAIYNGWDSMADYRGFDSTAVEKRSGQRIGWYGGEMTVAAAYTPNKVGNASASIKLHNEETLYAEAEVTIPDELWGTVGVPGSLNSLINIQIKVKGTDSGSTWTSPLYSLGKADDGTVAGAAGYPDLASFATGYDVSSGAGVRYDGFNGNKVSFRFMLDQADIFTPSVENLSFKRFTAAYGGGGYSHGTFNGKLTPGEDIILTLEVSSYDGKMPTVMDLDLDNSLFAGAEDTDGDGVNDRVYVEYGRHLQNLDTAISGFSPSVSASVEQVADLSFKKVTSTSNRVWNGVYTGINFKPLTNTNIISYDGKKHKINDITIATTAADDKDAGMFAAASASAGMEIMDLTVVDANITAADSSSNTHSAGVLVGKAVTGLNIHDVTIEGAQVTASGNGSAGGLAGATDDDIAVTTVDILDNTTGVHTQVMSGGTGGAGGVVGASGASIDIIDTIVSNASVSAVGGNAGGLVGAAAGITGKVKNVISSSYIAGTVSATGTGTDAGGLVGVSSGDGKLIMIDARSIGSKVSAASAVGGLIGNVAGDVDITYSSASMKWDVSGQTTRLNKAVIAGDKVNVSGDGDFIPVSTIATSTDWITGGLTAGGLVGQISGTAVIGGSYAATAVNSSTASLLGGLVGQGGSSLTLQNSYADTYLKGAATARIGGLVGDVAPGATTASFENCYSAGFLMGEANEAAGFMPGSASSVTNSYSAFNYDDIFNLTNAPTTIAAADTGAVGEKYADIGAVGTYPPDATPLVADVNDRYGLVKTAGSASAAYYTYGDVNPASITGIDQVTGKELATNDRSGVSLLTYTSSGSSGLVAPANSNALSYNLATFFGSTAFTEYPYATVKLGGGDVSYTKGDDTAGTVTIAADSQLRHENDWLSNDVVNNNGFEIDLFSRLYDSGLSRTVADKFGTEFDSLYERMINDDGMGNTVRVEPDNNDYMVELPAAPVYEGYDFVGWYAAEDIYYPYIDEGTGGGSNYVITKASAIKDAAEASAKGVEGYDSLTSNEKKYEEFKAVRKAISEYTSGTVVDSVQTGGFIPYSRATDKNATPVVLMSYIDADTTSSGTMLQKKPGAGNVYTIPQKLVDGDESNSTGSVRAYQRIYAVYQQKLEIELFARLYDEDLQLMEDDEQAEGGEKKLSRKATLTGSQTKDAFGNAITTYTANVGEAEAFTGYKFVGWFEASALHDLTNSDIEAAYGKSLGKAMTTGLSDSLTEMLKNKELNHGKSSGYVSIAKARELELSGSGSSTVAKMDMSATYDYDSNPDTPEIAKYDESAQAYRRLYAVYKNTKPHTVTVAYRYLPMPTDADINKAVMDIYAGNLSTNISETLKYEIAKVDDGETYATRDVPVKSIAGYEVVANYESVSDGKTLIGGKELKNYKGWVVQLDQTDPDNIKVTDWTSKANDDKTQFKINTDKPYTYVVLYTYSQVKIHVKYVFHTSSKNDSVAEESVTNTGTRILELTTQEARDALLTDVNYKADVGDTEYTYIINDEAEATSGSSAEDALSIEQQAQFTGFDLRKIKNDAIAGDSNNDRALELHYYRKNYTLSFDIAKGIYNEDGVIQDDGKTYSGSGYKPYKSVYFGEDIKGDLENNDDSTLKRKGYAISNWNVDPLTETADDDTDYSVSPAGGDGVEAASIKMPAADVNATVTWVMKPTSYRVEMYYQDPTDPYMRSVSGTMESSVSYMGDNTYLLFGQTEDAGFTAEELETLADSGTSEADVKEILGIAYKHESNIPKDEHHAHLVDNYTYTEKATSSSKEEKLTSAQIYAIIDGTDTTRTITGTTFKIKSNNSGGGSSNRKEYYFDTLNESRGGSGGGTTHSDFASLTDEQIKNFKEGIEGINEVYVNVSTLTDVERTINEPFYAPDKTKISTELDESGQLVIRLYYYRKEFTVVFCFKSGSDYPFNDHNAAKTGRNAIFKAMTGYENDTTDKLETTTERITKEGNSGTSTYGYTITCRGLYGASFTRWQTTYRWKHYEQSGLTKSNSYTVRLDKYWDEYSSSTSGVYNDTIHYIAYSISGTARRLYFMEQSESDGASNYRSTTSETDFQSNSSGIKYFDLTKYDEYPAQTGMSNIVFNSDGTAKMAVTGYKYWNYALGSNYPKNTTGFGGSNLKGGYNSNTGTYIKGLSENKSGQLYFSNGSNNYTSVFFIRDTFTIYERNLNSTVEKKYLYKDYVASLDVPTASQCPYGTGYTFGGWFLTSEFTDSSGNIIEANRVTKVDETTGVGTGVFTDTYFEKNNGVEGKGIPMPAENLSFVAYWKPADVTVKYHTLDPTGDTSGGDIYDYAAVYEKTVSRGGIVSISDPIVMLNDSSVKRIAGGDLSSHLSNTSSTGKAGVFYQIKSGETVVKEWEFEGWYYSDVNGNPTRGDLNRAYNMKLAVSEDTDIYAKWTQIKGEMTIEVVPYDIKTGKEIVNSDNTSLRYRFTTPAVSIGDPYTVYARNDIPGYWPVLASYTFTVAGDKATISMNYDSSEAWAYYIDCYVLYENGDQKLLVPIALSVTGKDNINHTFERYTDAQVAQIAAPTNMQMTGYKFASTQIDFVNTGGYATKDRPDSGTYPVLRVIYTVENSGFAFSYKEASATKSQGETGVDYTDAKYFAGENTTYGKLPAEGTGYDLSGSGTSAALTGSGTYSIKEVYTITGTSREADGKVYAYERTPDTADPVDLALLGAATAPTGLSPEALVNGDYTIAVRLVLEDSSGSAINTIWNGGTASFKVSRAYTVTFIIADGTDQTALYYNWIDDKFYSSSEFTTEAKLALSYAGDYYTTGSSGEINAGSTLAAAVSVDGSITLVDGVSITKDCSLKCNTGGAGTSSLTGRLPVNIAGTDGVVDRVVYYDPLSDAYYDAPTDGNQVEVTGGE